LLLLYGNELDALVWITDAAVALDIAIVLNKMLHQLSMTCPIWLFYFGLH